jgi:hypothetical protein
MTPKEVILKALRRELSDVQDDIARSELEFKRILAWRHRFNSEGLYQSTNQDDCDKYLTEKRAQEKEILDAIEYVNKGRLDP